MLLLKVIIELIGILLIGLVLIQPAQKTGLIGDATDSEKRTRFGFELYSYRFTVVLIFLLISLSTLYGAIQSGLFLY